MIPRSTWLSNQRLKAHKTALTGWKAVYKKSGTGCVSTYSSSIMIRWNSLSLAQHNNWRRLKDQDQGGWGRILPNWMCQDSRLLYGLPHEKHSSHQQTFIHPLQHMKESVANKVLLGYQHNKDHNTGTSIIQARLLQCTAIRFIRTSTRQTSENTKHGLE